MTDDQTRQMETPGQPDPMSTGDAQATPTAASDPAGPGPVVESSADAAPVTSVATPASGSNRVRWAVGLGVAALAIAIAIGAVLVFGSRPSPEALKYIPADAAVVVEIRP